MVTEEIVDAPPTPLLSDGEKAKGYVLACQSRVTGDVSVRIPEEAIARKLKIAGMGRMVTEEVQGLVAEIDPMPRTIPLTLAPPTLTDSVSDLDRLNRGLKKEGCDVARLNVHRHRHQWRNRPGQPGVDDDGCLQRRSGIRGRRHPMGHARRRRGHRKSDHRSGHI